MTIGLGHIYIYSTAMQPNNTYYKFTSESESEKCESQSAYGKVMDKSMVANFFDSQCSIQALITVRRSYNYMPLNSVVMFL